MCSEKSGISSVENHFLKLIWNWEIVRLFNYGGIDAQTEIVKVGIGFRC